jgi:UDP-4-amino-4,6-dideoxy-N-acetyl-beta-L-altrosamine transaminase
MIPYGRQDISDEDVEAVIRVLRSDFLTQGPAVPAFERRVSELCGAPHAIAVNSATSALHVACLALGVRPGSLVWTSPITFVASANCALYCGAEVDFVDIDPRTYNLDPEALRTKLEAARAANRLPDVVIPVHFSGKSCDMAAIHRLGREYGFRIIEDASHAIGGSYQGERIGGCRYSDITVFSFHPVKIITTAEGGLLTTRDGAIAEELRRLRSHGITRDRSAMTCPDEGDFYYEQVGLGFNYRMTDVQAALGSSQLTRIDAFLARRREIASRYDALLSDLPLTLPFQDGQGESAWHLYVVLVDPIRTRRTRREVFDRMRANGIGVNVHYIPVYRQPHYRRLGAVEGLPHAEQYYARTVTIPMHTGLTERMQDDVVSALREALGER